MNIDEELNEDELLQSAVDVLRRCAVSIAERKGDVNELKAAALKICKALTDTYIETATNDFVLRPERLTEDYRLLTMGFPLTVSDINALALRNKHNPTMLRLIREYAIRHNTNIPGEARADLDRIEQVHFARAVMQRAEEFAEKWITTPDALPKLEKMFARKNQ